MTSIAPGSHVTLHYRMALMVDGVERELVDTFKGKPATLQMGAGQWSPSIENRLVGLAEGATAQFDVPAEQAYGAHRRELVRRLERGQVQAALGAQREAAVGEALEIRTAEGIGLRGVLVECGQDEALVDFNHPLAGLPVRVRVHVIGVL
jgi:FKBP-type peptidyl-prolyl cis-trans isomerase SlpA